MYYRVVLIFLVLCGVSSCVTEKACFRKFPSSNDTVKIVLKRDSLVFRDTTLFITLPSQIIVDSVVIPCPPLPPSYVPDTARAETDYAKAEAWFSYPYIDLRLTQKRSVLEIQLDSVIQEVYHWKNEYEKVVITKVQKIPNIYKVALYAAIGQLILIILLVVLKLK